MIEICIFYQGHHKRLQNIESQLPSAHIGIHNNYLLAFCTFILGILVTMWTRVKDKHGANAVVTSESNSIKRQVTKEMKSVSKSHRKVLETNKEIKTDTSELRKFTDRIDNRIAGLLSNSSAIDEQSISELTGIRESVGRQAGIIEALFRAADAVPAELVEFANSIGEQLNTVEENERVINDNLTQCFQRLNSLCDVVQQIKEVTVRFEQKHDEHLSTLITINSFDELVRKSVREELEDDCVV